jgi:diguanylate cyclase (GGDEF)-like protein/PAS domain S-box-containing protein
MTVDGPPTPEAPSASDLPGLRGVAAESDARLTLAILESALDCVIVMDDAGRVLEFNRSAVATFGHPRAEAIGAELAQLLVPPALRDRHRAALGRFLETGQGTILNQRIELPAVHADGHEVPVELTVTSVAGAQPPLFVGYLRDLTDQHRARRRDAAQHAVVQALVESGSAEEAIGEVLIALGEALSFEVGAMWLVDEPGQTLRCTSFWQHPSVVVDEFHEATMRLAIPRGLGPLGRAWDSRRPSRTTDTPAEPDYPRADASARAGLHGGLWVPVVSGGAVLGVLEFYSRAENPLDDGLLATLSLVGSQVGEFLRRRRAEDELAHQALHDQLTGLPNRAMFADQLERALGHSSRGGRPVAVLFIDLDDFKAINDTLGHQAGDELLTAVAERLRGTLRRGEMLARFGGDEFVILLEELTDVADPVSVAERITTALQAAFVLQGKEHLVTASVGIAVADSGDANSTDLLRDADVAMYRAKEHGRARYELFDERLRDRALTRVRLGKALRGAADRGELRLVYQPIFSVGDRSLAGVEALLRWKHPEWGDVSPAEFIPAAERSGLMVPIGTWVLEEACRQAARWRDLHAGPEPIPVSINVSAHQLIEPAFVDAVARAIGEAAIDAGQLTLEITETVLMQTSGSPLDTLHSLRELGVRVVLDDFGTGYSSLSYVDRFPLDGIKVDRAFIAGLNDSQTSHAILAAVVTMADTLELPVVAEGVETAGQLADIQRLGCHLAQGYHLGRPVPAADMTTLIRDHLAADRPR